MKKLKVSFVGLPDCDCGKCEEKEIYVELDEPVVKKAHELQSYGVRFTAKPQLENSHVAFAALSKHGGLPISHAFCRNAPGTVEAVTEMISVAHAMVFYKFDTYE